MVPEYDQVSPVLAKPVRLSLHGLAAGITIAGLCVGSGDRPLDRKPS